MSRIPAFRLAVVRCGTCGSRNATDAWRSLRGGRARCGRCGSALPRRLPRPVQGLGLAVLLAGALAGFLLVQAGRQGSAERREAEVLALVEEGRHEEAALRLLDGEPAPALRRRAAQALAEALVREGSADPERAGRAHERGDALLALHAEQWPELVRALAGSLDELRDLRDAVLRADALAATADLEAFASERDRGRAQARRWSPSAAAWYESRARGLEDELRLQVVRELWAEDPQRARATLTSGASSPPVRREASAAPAPAPSPPGAEAEAEAPAEPEATARTRQAIDARDLTALLGVVRLRPGESWSAAERTRFERELQRACLALASLASAEAAATPSAERQVERLDEALTCDEALPEQPRRELLASLALAELGAAAQGARELPDVERLVRRLDGTSLEAALAALACLAEREDRPGLALEALRRIARSPRLGEALRCELQPPEPRPPVLDYPSSPLDGAAP